MPSISKRISKLFRTKPHKIPPIDYPCTVPSPQVCWEGGTFEHVEDITTLPPAQVEQIRNWIYHVVADIQWLGHNWERVEFICQEWKEGGWAELDTITLFELQDMFGIEIGIEIFKANVERKVWRSTRCVILFSDFMNRDSMLTMPRRTPSGKNGHSVMPTHSGADVRTCHM